jgi:hypothetical protein
VPENFTARNSAAAVQQASAERNTTTKSPSWLNPVVTMPSQEFQANVQAIDTSMHQELAEVIFSNCRVACFDFYRANGLWRTRYGRDDGILEPKLFQLDTGGFPKSAGDLTLRDWLVKIQRAFSRINEEDTVHAGDFYDFLGIGDSFRRMTRICSLTNHLGRLDTENFEEYLLISLQICRQINGWDSFGRLKVLWEDLHKRPTDVGESQLKLDLESLKPPPE